MDINYEQEIKNVVVKYNCLYINIDNEKSINNIYHLFIKNIVFEPELSIEMLYLGYYYNNIEKDYNQMKKYYLMAIDKGDVNAMTNLVVYYKNENKDIKILKLYTLYSHFVTRSKIIDQFNTVACKTFLEQEIKFLNLLTTFTFNENDNLYTSLKLLLNSINTQLSMIELHFEYTMNGKGYNDAKQDFLIRCVDQKLNF